MNERINELAEQAEVTIGGDFTFNGGEVAIVDLEKFAKLIINKCAMIARKMEIHKSPYIGVTILEHFGVEE